MATGRAPTGKMLIVIGGAVAGLLASAAIFYTRTATAQLEVAKFHIDELLDTRDPRKRQQEADSCLRIVEPLVQEADPIGATASLFVISVTPLGTKPPAPAVALEIPSADRVETIDTENLLRIARLLFHTRRFGPADQLIDLILSRDDKFREDGLRLAITIRFESGRDRDVIRHCQEVLKTSPDDPGMYRVMAMVHRNHGRLEDFIEATKNQLELETGSALETRINLVDAYVKLGRTEEARLTFDKVKAEAPHLADRVPALRAQLLVQEGQSEQASAILDEILATNPRNPDALILKGTLLVEQQSFSDAIRILKTATEIAPAEEVALYQLGQAYARSGQAELAKATLASHQKLLDKKVGIQEMEQLASQQPDNVAVRVELAHAYADIGLMELADFWTRAASAADGR